ncbi:LOW QUALITY PROTEIN: PI31_Prot_C domain-containing protein/PI31_Prot_N domain-containing protein [Cephalotus follicularis]|uniref:PI31_Prot_C domain-containing protein/PI31_Prot_N domain-containing protein n=1 Tax=Cephalotus follicularis TaxID=3775 RepID=A0A1Q3BCE1_CEPFO|nr:LOW QUALITY PROTEIN: PI31_Prot_C domain-containing protein/PI31_Prot_N domain-containing protein [Cephalotus follicularis]
MANEKSVMAVIRAARPSFRNNDDKIAFCVHATFLASGYVLTAAGPPAFADTALSSPSTDEVGIDHWNDTNDEYAFVYTNPEKDKKVLVKCLVMNDKLVVDALADGDSEPLHVEIDVGDYVGENGTASYAAQFRDLEGLVKKLNTEILSKLNGSSKASASSNPPPSSQTSEGSRRGTNDHGDDVPVGPQIHPSGFVHPPVNPYGVSDLFPGPGAGMYPTRGAIGSGGMLLGPNDPNWFGGVGGEPGFPGGQPAVPPGARFDPYGPPGIPGFEPSRFARFPRRPGSGTHPDLEHFGSGSDFI